jgi:hypothetical protein
LKLLVPFGVLLSPQYQQERRKLLEENLRSGEDKPATPNSSWSDGQYVTVTMMVSLYAPGVTSCPAANRPKTVDTRALPLPVKLTVLVPTVLPQLTVRAASENSAYPSVVEAGPVIFRVVTVAPVASPALRPTLYGVDPHPRIKANLVVRATVAVNRSGANVGL